MNSATLLGTASVLLAPKRGIFPQDSAYSKIVADATVEEIHTDTLEITDHPIQNGANIADHAFKRPAELVLRYGFSDSNTLLNSSLGSLGTLALTQAGGGRTAARVSTAVGVGAVALSQVIGGPNSPLQTKSNKIYERLLDLQRKRILIDIYTGKRYYKNMLLQEIQTESSYKSAYSMIAMLHCKEVIIVDTQTGTINTSDKTVQRPSDMGQKYATFFGLGGK